MNSYQSASRPHSVSHSGVTGGGQCVPQRLLTGKFLLTYREKRGKAKMEKGEKKRRKIGRKREGGKLKWKEGKVPKRKEDLSFFLSFFFFSFLFFFFFFFFFSLFFKTTKICFGSTKMEIFYRGKSISRRREKKIMKMTLPPQKKSCYAPGVTFLPLRAEYQDNWNLNYDMFYISFTQSFHCYLSQLPWLL